MEEATNFYPVDDKEGVFRDLMICKERKQQQRYYRLNTQNHIKTNYIYYTEEKLHQSILPSALEEVKGSRIFCKDE